MCEKIVDVCSIASFGKGRIYLIPKKLNDAPCTCVEEENTHTYIYI